MREASYISAYWREVLYRFNLALELPELKGDPLILEIAEQIRIRRANQVLSRIVGLVEWDHSPFVVAARFGEILTALRDPDANSWLNYECLGFWEWIQQYDGKADMARKGHRPRPRRKRRNGTTSVSQKESCYFSGDCDV